MNRKQLLENKLRKLIREELDSWSNSGDQEAFISELEKMENTLDSLITKYSESDDRAIEILDNVRSLLAEAIEILGYDYE